MMVHKVDVETIVPENDEFRFCFTSLVFEVKKPCCPVRYKVVKSIYYYGLLCGVKHAS